MLTESISQPSGPAAILLLAVIQGIAEFLPISSSGHLVLAHVAMGVEEAGMALDVALHLGTLVAVLLAFRSDVKRLVLDVLAGRLGLALWLVVATVPIGLVGVLFKDDLEATFRTVVVAGAGLLFTALALIVGEVARRRSGADDIELPPKPRLVHALIIGGAQVLALVPGISRSGVTIAAGLVSGLPSKEAARLSFLMSLPAVAGAAVVTLPDAVEEGFSGLAPVLVGSAVALAAVVGWLSLRVLMFVLPKGAFRWFAVYCATVGTLVLVFH